MIIVVIELSYFIVTDQENKQTKQNKTRNKNQTQFFHHEFGACQKFCKL